MDFAQESPAGFPVDSVPDYYREIVFNSREGRGSFGSAFGGLYPMEVHHFIDPLPVVLFVTGEDWECYHGDGGEYKSFNQTEAVMQQPLSYDGIIERRDLFTSTHALYDSIVCRSREWLRPTVLKPRPNGSVMPSYVADLRNFSVVPDTGENAPLTTQQQQRLQREREERERQGRFLRIEWLLEDSDFDSDSDSDSDSNSDSDSGSDSESESGSDSDSESDTDSDPYTYLNIDPDTYSDTDSNYDLEMELATLLPELSDASDQESQLDSPNAVNGVVDLTVEHNDSEITLTNENWEMRDSDSEDSDDGYEDTSRLVRLPPRPVWPRHTAEQRAIRVELSTLHHRLGDRGLDYMTQRMDEIERRRRILRQRMNRRMYGRTLLQSVMPRQRQDTDAQPPRPAQQPPRQVVFANLR
ncbi:hypothetical protein GGR57DRAFT_478998 [Xylariaceae sp. FL1272]|nr:hypothetical protein GGR57DRAFT_478998 [Xylariaceae sp. FL1272]